MQYEYETVVERYNTAILDEFESMQARINDLEDKVYELENENEELREQLEAVEAENGD